MDDSAIRHYGEMAGKMCLVAKSIWQAAWGTSFGQIWQWQLVLSSLALIALFIHQRSIRNISLLLISTLMLVLHAFIGHSAMFYR